MKPTIKNNKNAAMDEDNVRYKINVNYFNNKIKEKPNKVEKLNENDDENIRYKFPTVFSKSKATVSNPKDKIKVNFWSNPKKSTRLSNNGLITKRHSIDAPKQTVSPKPKSPNVKVRKRVSFLPSPVFSDNHIPMVTVPDDVAILLNRQKAIDFGEDLTVNSFKGHKSNLLKRKPPSVTTQTGSSVSKHQRYSEDFNRGNNHQNHGNENELEFFSKYVVQKLRRMETNQRIYSENLINTVLMLGQLNKLSSKSKISDT